MRYRHGFLVATLRHREDPFPQSVIYLCEHSEQGSLGLLINKPLTLSVTDLIKTSFGIQDNNSVYLGGTIQTQERGFILHRHLGSHWQGTTQLANDLYLTTTHDLLAEISQFPNDLYKVFVGYTGWKPGQLEYEMSQDYWLWIPFDQEILFQCPDQDIWHHCYSIMGFSADQIGCVDPGMVLAH
jgi:putative transcriptional regulator